jgi:hypothetical protein
MAILNTAFAGVDIPTGFVSESAVELIEETASEPESHVAPTARLEALSTRLQAAVTTSERTELALSDLLVTAKFLGAAIGEVRDTNSELVFELSALSQAVAAQAKHRRLLEDRIERLQVALAQGRDEAARERARLLSEHDGFIAMLMADHEREIDSLRHRPVDRDVREPPRPVAVQRAPRR